MLPWSRRAVGSRSVAGGTWGCGYAWVPVTGRVALRPNRSLRAERGRTAPHVARARSGVPPPCRKTAASTLSPSRDENSMRNNSSRLVIAAKDKISPHRGCTNALRLQLRGAEERPGGPRAGDRDERAERTDATNPRGSAAGFRKRRARPKRKRMDAEAAGGEGNLPIAEPP